MLWSLSNDFYQYKNYLPVVHKAFTSAKQAKWAYDVVNMYYTGNDCILEMAGVLPHWVQSLEDKFAKTVKDIGEILIGFLSKNSYKWDFIVATLQAMQK